MKKTIIITTTIIGILAILFWLLIKSNGYEFPRKDKYLAIPYFPKISDSVNFDNQVLDTMYVINYYANKKTIFLRYSKTEDTYKQNFITLVNHSFKKLNYQLLTDKDKIEIDTANQLLFILRYNTSGKISKSEVVDLLNGHSKDAKEINHKSYLNRKEGLRLVRHSSFNGRDTRFLYLKDEMKNYFFIQGDDADKTGKLLTLREAENFDFSIGWRIGGDPEINHKNINLFDYVVRKNEFKRLLSIPTPSSYVNPFPSDRPLRNEGYSINKGWFDKYCIYYFKMNLKSAEVKFKTTSYYNSETFFDQLNDPQSDTDTLFYFSNHKIYKFYQRTGAN